MAIYPTQQVNHAPTSNSANSAPPIHSATSHVFGGKQAGRHRHVATEPLFLVTVTALIILLTVQSAAYAQQDDLLTVTYIDQETEGESTLIIFPNNDVLLIDGGVKSGFRDHVVPVLEHHKITTIDLVLVTHKDTDHLNGINALLGDGAHTVSEIWFSPPIANNTRTNELYGHVERLGTALSYPTTGQTKTFGDATIEVLHPQTQLQFNDDNDNSIVTLLEYGELEILFTGDIEKDAEASIITHISGDKIDVDIMNAPHHGSESSSTPAFIKATSPDLVIYGAHARDGGKDKHDNPDDGIIARYNAIGARQLQTGADGNIVIQTNGHGCTLILENGIAGSCFADIMTVEESNTSNPTHKTVPDVKITTDKNTYNYCENLSYTVTVSKVTGERGTVHIIDQNGKGSQAIPMVIDRLQNVVHAPFPFERDIFPTGKYTIMIQYSGADDAASFELRDAGNICIPSHVKQITMSWLSGALSDGFVLDAIEKSVDDSLIHIPFDINQGNIYEIVIPEWVKQVAHWWMSGLITDDMLAQILDHLLETNAIYAPSHADSGTT